METTDVTSPMLPSSTFVGGDQTQVSQPVIYPSLQQPHPGPSTDGTVCYPEHQPNLSISQETPADLFLLPHHQLYEPHQQVAVTVGADTKVRLDPIESYTLHMVLGCFVCWCCNALFGLVAWILARE